MLDSPSIQKIAASLMTLDRHQPQTGPQSQERNPIHASVRPTVRTPNRVLCLKLKELPSSGFKRSHRLDASGSVSMKAVIEAFLKYSPRVQARPVERSSEKLTGAQGVTPHWVFIDIGSTSHLFHGEEGLMKSAMSLARDLGFGVQCAAADTPAGAQAFAIAHHEYICPPGEERERLKQLSLPLLLHLEGLEAWDKPSTVENLTAFFMMLGFKTLADLTRFTSSSLQERWGETGGTLWKRLNAQDRPQISPLLPTEPLEDYVHLDFPVSLVSLLLHQSQRSMDFLFARLQGRRLFAQKLTLILHCEYSKAQHRLEIEPKTPSRNRELFATLLENKLSELDLENPIRDFEMHIVPCPEKSQQLDFFEPRTTDFDKLQTLVSLLGQSSVKPGLYRIEPSVLPEKSWQLVNSAQETQTNETKTRLPMETVGAPKVPASLLSTAKGYAGSVDICSGSLGAAGAEARNAIAPAPRYGESVLRSPRPTRLLKKPLPLSIQELQRLKILSSHPIERLETAWWESDDEDFEGNAESACGRPCGDARSSWQKRDYYFAVSPEGQCLWIYQDLRSEEYFLHGYFD